ncbi:MAG: hypothetical protein PVI26_04990 [Chitinispirillia bacterium]
MLNINCNLISIISDDVSVVKSEFFNEVKNYRYIHDTLFIFNLNYGNQVNLSGSRSCTTYVNNAVSLIYNDSIYRRISTSSPTLLTIGDSTYGCASIKVDDIANWDSFLSTIKDTSRVLGKIIKTYLDPNTSEAIKSYNSAVQMTALDKYNVVTTLHELLNNELLLYKYKTSLTNELKLFPEVVSSLHEDILHMVNLSIFLDTLGSAKPLNLIPESEKEAIRWFNRKIITHYLDNPTGIYSIVKIFRKYPISGRIYQLLFQQSTSKNMDSAKSILRYLEVRNSLMSQLAYTDDIGFHSLINDETRVFDYMWVTDIDSAVTPLFWNPEVIFIPDEKIPDLLISGDAVMELAGYSASNDTAFYNFKSFYVLSGKILYNEEPLVIIGTIKTVIGVTKFPGNDQGYISGWNTELWLHGQKRDGTNFKYVGHYLLNAY